MKWSSGRSRFISSVDRTSPTAASSDPVRSLFTALCSICRYISKPTEAIAPCCSVPSRLPAPRISRSRSAILNPWPSSCSPEMTSSRLSACSVSDRGHVGLDRLSCFGRRLDHAHVADAADRHVQRARDGRRRQREHIELGAQLFQALLLHDTEPMLFVDDKQPKALEPDVALEQAVRADHDVDVPGLQAFDRPLLRLVIDEGRRHLDQNRELRQTLPETVQVLF